MNNEVEPTKVAVGTSTVAGYSVTAVGFVAAIIAYATGDHSAQTLGTLTAAAVALLAFLVTQAGRYVQAHTLAKGVAEKIAASPTPPTNVVGVAGSDARPGDKVAIYTSGAASVETDTLKSPDVPGHLVTQVLDPDLEDVGDHDAIPDIWVKPPDQVGRDEGDSGSPEVPPIPAPLGPPEITGTHPAPTEEVTS